MKQGQANDCNLYIEAARSLPVYDTVDVLVLGAGVSGFAAAVMAARQGVKTLLADAAGSVGGISTTGLMNHFTGTVNSALYDEVLRRMMDKRDAMNIEAPAYVIDPEALKAVYLEMLEESGAGLLLYTLACMPILENGRVKGAILENKSGRQAVYARVVIDATGDGDIAARAGVPFILGREEDGSMQPATLMFKLGGVQTERAVFPCSFETLVPTEKGELQALAKRLLPSPAGHVLLYKSSLPGIVTVNIVSFNGCVQLL